MFKERSTEIVNFMTPRAGILVLGRGKIIHTVKMLYFFTNLLFTQAYIRQTESLVMMTKKESTKIVNFRGSCAGGVVVYIVNMLYISPLLVYTRTWIKHIKYTAIMSKVGSAKIVNFIVNVAGVLC